MSYAHETARTRWRELLRQYQDPPKGIEARRELNHRLYVAESDLLLCRPVWEEADGEIRQAGAGLITADEVRAGASPEGLEQLEAFDHPKRPRIRDVFKVTPVRLWRDRLAEKRAAEAITPGLGPLTLSQRSIGSCGSEGASGLTMLMQRTQRNAVVEKLNAYALYGLVNGGYDRGSSLSDNVAAILKYGVPTERVWSRSHSWREKLSDDAKHDALRNRPDEIFRVSNREEFGEALLEEFGVYFGYSGHAIFGFELIDEDRLWYQNSWDQDWGENGAGTISFRSIYWGYGAWAFRTARRPS